MKPVFPSNPCPLVIDAVTPPPPAWIRRADGQVAPFEPHLISQALFAASEDLGQPNAFLARELTDSIVHFFAQEAHAAVATTDQLAELIEKVVRELGQPALARAYQERRRRQALPAASSATADLAWASRFPGSASPLEVVRASLIEYSLRAVYSPDLAAAHREGLLILTDLEQPDRLRSALVDGRGRGPLADMDLLRLYLEARTRAGCHLVVDGPERWVYTTPASAVRQLFEAFTALDLVVEPLTLLLHLNAPPPAQAEEGSPLFGAIDKTLLPNDPFAWIEHLLEQSGPRLQIAWHLGKHYDMPDQAPTWFQAWARQTDLWPRICFLFQRGRQPVRLSDGMVRGQAGVLGLVGLNLPRLAAWPGVDGDPMRFLSKLPSLARMGVAAGVQRRHYLRRLPHLQAGFITERAPWLVAPVGLDATVQSFLGAGMAASPASLDLGVRIITTLRAALAQETRHAHLEVLLEGNPDASPPSAAEVWGLTPWDFVATSHDQLHAAAALHRAAGGGRACLHIATEVQTAPAFLWQLLHTAAAQTEVACLGFAHLDQAVPGV